MQKIEIIMNSVNSSNIEAIGYNPVFLMLEVKFKNGTAYRYKNVPMNIYQELRDSESKGKYLAKIKSLFPAEKIEPEKDENSKNNA